MDVSIIIVNYNTKDITRRCIDSIFKNVIDVSFEVLLVDNASQDGSREYFSKQKNITYIYLDNNYGFGYANNIGAKYSKGQYLFFLNSDTLLINNAVLSFYKYMEENIDIASCGGNLVTPSLDNAVCHGCFPSILDDFSKIGFKRFYKSYYDNYISLAQTINLGNTNDVRYICGADIFIRKNLFDEFCGFDTDYFMYYEETDLYYRLYKAGYKSIILSNINIIHLEGGSSTHNDIQAVNKFNMLFKSRFIFFKKNKPRYQLLLLRLFNLISILMRINLHKSDLKQRIRIVLKNY